MFKNAALAVIRAYQRFFSPDHSIYHKWKYPFGYCPFYPSCSEYAKLSIEKYGIILGMIKSFWRILRCNPFAKGGVDNP